MYQVAYADALRYWLDKMGLPRLIIAGFLILLYIVAPFVGADFATQITNTVNRFSWNAILVLAMVPMVHSGCGLNFGLPLMSRGLRRECGCWAVLSFAHILSLHPS